MFVGFQTSTSVGASSPYLWTTKYLTNNNIAYDSTTGIFSIRTPGWYEVSMDTSAAAAAGAITPTLYINGVASTSALGTANSTAITDFRNIKFSTIIYVVPSSTTSFATLQVVNTGVAATTRASNITIKRIG